MALLYPEVRLVFWTGRKFLYVGKEDFRKKDIDNIIFRYGYREAKKIKFLNSNCSEWIAISPVVVSCNLNTEGGGGATINFIIGTEGSHMYKKKFMFRSEHQNRSKDYGEDWKYFEEVINSYIKPHLEYYENYDLFSNEYILKEDFFSEPNFIFQPPGIVWIFAKDVDKNWYKIFTGFISKLSETDRPGSTRTITINVIPIVQYLSKMPFYYMKYKTYLLDQILPIDEDRRKILRVYLASVFSGLESVGINLLAELKMSELFKKITFAVNRRIGAVIYKEMLLATDFKNERKEIEKEFIKEHGEEEVRNIKKIKEKLKSALENTKAEYRDYIKGPGFGLEKITKDDVNKYMDYVDEHGFFKFKLYNFDEKENHIYKGKSLKLQTFEKEGLVGPRELFGKTKINLYTDATDCEIISLANIYLGQDFWSEENRIYQVFQKMFKWALTYYSPQTSTISNVLKEIQGTLNVNIFNDGNGDLIVEYPRYNDKPGKSLFHEDHSSKYIIPKYDISSMSFTSDIDKFTGMIALPTRYHIVDQGNLKESSYFTGRSWAPMSALLRYGFSSVQLRNIYTTVGGFPIKESKKESKKE